MRDIKFRVWDKENKRMYTPGDMWIIQFRHDDGPPLHVKLFGFEADLWEDTCEIMQFTGLLDKNGNEIYEGDIVFVTNPSPYGKSKKYIVEWNERECSWDGIFPTIIDQGYIHEIIGNIHENPELISN